MHSWWKRRLRGPNEVTPEDSQTWQHIVEVVILPQFTDAQLDNFLQLLSQREWRIPKGVQLPAAHRALLQDCLRAEHMVEIVKEKIIQILANHEDPFDFT